VTSAATIPADLVGVGTFVQKSPGVACGLPLVAAMLPHFDERLRVEMIPGFHLEVVEGRFSEGNGSPLLRVRGPLRSLLAAERTVLNILSHLGGVASLTRKFAKRCAGTNAHVYDTRKTRPGYRLLDKYAVLVGGGRNHRMGLHDMVLVKDNHLAHMPPGSLAERLTVAVKLARDAHPGIGVEVEVDTLEQFRQVLTVPGVDVILLDNMTCPTMRQAVALRDTAEHQPALEASGKVTLETVRDIAQTGVERIAVGALTHSAIALDIGLDVEVA
jgi:nicotinate-nucleotide pyrophosphorylase (carboxylating)